MPIIGLSGQPASGKVLWKLRASIPHDGTVSRFVREYRNLPTLIIGGDGGSISSSSSIR